jgi:hypothetical protein
MPAGYIVMENKELYSCNDINAAKELMSETVSVARNAEYKHAECHEELQSLQMLCQYLHGNTTIENAKLIEWVFAELYMNDILLSR